MNLCLFFIRILFNSVLLAVEMGRIKVIHGDTADYRAKTTGTH